MPWLVALLKKVGSYLAPLALNWLFDFFKSLIEKAKKKKADMIAKHEALKKYEAVVKNPNSTIEEKDRAKAEFLNS